MTFSIVARCRDTGRFGAAVASSSPAVAARCIRAMAGVGAAASQNVTDPALGPRALELMARGATPEQARDVIVGSAPFIEYRQLLLIDGAAPPAIHTGSAALGTIAEVRGADAACAGNLLANTGVPQAMLDAFERTGGHLGERLMQAMLAGQAAGGEAGPVHSAGLLVVDTLAWPVVDLRLDWLAHDPVGALYGAWQVYAPQIDAYVARARDPRAAPSYGVPGDL
ncbi:DUF1028 domain-containing protein [Variovorax sp. GB1R11]|uniref:DUF1028 domain-containing protein n=1 Tax=Variovorax sp. GB1R11 TaxID=3443741 RepID=UPI003F44BE59